MQKKSLIPILKLREKITHPDRLQRIPLSIVKMEELVLANGKPDMKFIGEIRGAGGLREYLKTSSKLIFSPILPDSTLGGMDFEVYSILFTEFQPDSYITPDAPTYTGCKKYSRDQIDIILELTEKMIKKFPECNPIGLIKGSNFPQMDFHSDKLRHDLGLSQFCLHAGDCLYNSPKYAKDRIVDYGRSLAEKGLDLMIYGVGSKHYFQRFHYASRFATNSHYMQAFNHKVVQGSTWTNFKGDFTKKIVMKNFNYLRKLVENPNDGQEITVWMAEAADTKQPNKISEISTVDQRILKILEK